MESIHQKLAIIMFVAIFRSYSTVIYSLNNKLVFYFRYYLILQRLRYFSVLKCYNYSSLLVNHEKNMYLYS
jgi:hypothetical protein